MTLLVFTLDYEPATDDILVQLTQAGVDWVRVNMNTFLTTVACSIHISDRDETFDLESYGRFCDLESISLVWFRKFTVDNNMPVPLTRSEMAFVKRELDHFCRGLFAKLSSKPWVNPFESSRRTKPEELAIAKRIGLHIPDTLVSNDPKRVRQFISAHGDYCIVKPISHGMVRDPLTTGPVDTRAEGMGTVSYFTICYTERIRLSDLSELAISTCPAIYQELLDRDYDIRLTIIGDQFFPVAIHSREGGAEEDASVVDWRRNENITHIKHEIIDLPQNLQYKLRQLVDELGLSFACIDLVKTKAGEYIFLEANDCGQWGWVEELTGAPITQALADHLIASMRQSETRLPIVMSHA